MISPITFILTKMFTFYLNLDLLSLMNFDKVKNKLTLNFSWLKPKEPTLFLNWASCVGMCLNGGTLLSDSSTNRQDLSLLLSFLIAITKYLQAMSGSVLVFCPVAVIKYLHKINLFCFELEMSPTGLGKIWSPETCAVWEVLVWSILVGAGCEIKSLLLLPVFSLSASCLWLRMWALSFLFSLSYLSAIIPPNYDGLLSILNCKSK